MTDNDRETEYDDHSIDIISARRKEAIESIRATLVEIRVSADELSSYYARDRTGCGVSLFRLPELFRKLSEQEAAARAIDALEADLLRFKTNRP